MSQKKTMRFKRNVLVHTDCLALLERIPGEQIALAYLDPPWGTSGNFSSIDQTYDDQREPYRDFLSRVLQQIHRVLSGTGVLYYHHSPTSPLYISLVLDQIFGEDKRRAEIVWPEPRRFSSITGMSAHSTIFLYSKTDTYVQNLLYKPLTSDLIARYNHQDEAGSFMLRALTIPGDFPSRRFKWHGHELPPGQSWTYSPEALEQLEQQGKIYLDTGSRSLPRLKVYLADSPGLPIGNIWDDIPNRLTRDDVFERSQRFSTQKPITLLDRIIKMGSNPGDVILDPFCGSGTTLVAAHNNDRRWIGSDISEEAFRFVIKRLQAQIGLKPKIDYEIGDEQQLENSFKIIAQPYRDLITGIQENAVFVRDQPVSLEEKRICEFKEIKGDKPVTLSLHFT